MKRTTNSREVAKVYEALFRALSVRANRLGSSDPENAAQETLTRSLQNPASQAAIEYYFRGGGAGAVPEWPLKRVLAWLHGVLQRVVLEERGRAARRWEVPATGGGKVNSVDQPDPAPDQLEALLEKEFRLIVAECLPRLDDDYRAVLALRVQGRKYVEIATELRLNENTVATWLRRAMQMLARCVQRRLDKRYPLSSAAAAGGE